MSNREGRRWVLPVVGALVVGVVAAFAWRAESKRRTEAWRVLRERAAVMANEFPRGILPHAPLLGPTVPGEACEAYLRASELLQKALSGSPATKDMLDLAWGPEPPEPTAELLAPLQPAFNALAKGAACATIDYGAMWSALKNVSLIGTGHIAAAASMAMRIDSASGHHAAVVEATAHWLTVARDQWNFGVAVYDLSGTSNVEVICEFWTDSRLLALPPESRRILAEVLARFDAQCALTTKSPEGDFLWVLQAADNAAVLDRPSLEQLEVLLADIDALQASRASSWSLRERALENVKASRLDVPRSHMLEVERARRQGLTNFRLLRLAVAHHLGEPLPTLRDPLGDGDLTVVQREDGILLSSHGSIDGKTVERFVPRR